MKRIGIDVGGTNTDAVLIVDGKVLKGVKTPTTEDVTSGVRKATPAILRRASSTCSSVIDISPLCTTRYNDARNANQD